MCPTHPPCNYVIVKFRISIPGSWSQVAAMRIGTDKLSKDELGIKPSVVPRPLHLKLLITYVQYEI